MTALPAPIPHEEAQTRLLAMVQPLGAETLAVEAALGRYLAEPLLARRTQPAADLSAMDGYAVRADEPAGPWRVVGESAAGHPFAGTLTPGEAVRISTGALVPHGGGAILLQEDAVREGESLRLAGTDEAVPRHIRRAGLDFRKGEELLDAGARMTPARIALALSAGTASLAVGRLPTIAVLDSGDELATDPANLAPHQIPASNGPMLSAMAAPLVAQCRRIGPVPDTAEALAEALHACEDVDVLVTSGGASVGDHDLVRPALEAWGAHIAFWRIALKPGKPLLVAQRGTQLILGLPGNPVSSYVTAYLFLLPLLRRLAGSARPLPQPVSLPLAEPMPQTGARTEFVRGIFEHDGVTPNPQQDSSALASLAAANCLILRPAGSAAAEVGEVVRVYPLQNGGMA